MDYNITFAPTLPIWLLTGLIAITFLLVAWGLFKKVVIADNCAEFANYIFNNSADTSV